MTNKQTRTGINSLGNRTHKQARQEDSNVVVAVPHAECDNIEPQLQDDDSETTEHKSFIRGLIFLKKKITKHVLKKKSAHATARYKQSYVYW